MSIREIIQDRRDGRTQSYEQFEELARACVDKSAKDYQLSAWLMAAYLNPLNPQETADLTLALARSGETLDISGLPKPHIDKHSTGGVGDKTSIALLPILASCGATMVKISGRGLGITGGTIDKLASIPGFSTDLSPEQMIEQASRIGIALSGQTPALAPADKTLYALRDATETVGSIPLMVASILSKKVAVGAETIILDVKCGSGAYMKDFEQAKALATALKETGLKLGLTVRIAITDMDCPLGFMVGNALEVKEAFSTLKGEAKGRFPELIRELGSMVLEASGLAKTTEEAKATIEDAIASGRAADKARQWIAAQGGNPLALDDYSLLPSAPFFTELKAPETGWISRIDAETIGEAAIELGAGRKTKEDVLDLSAGIELKVDVGDPVAKGQAIATIYGARQELLDTQRKHIAEAFTIGNTKLAKKPLIMAVV